MYLIKSKKELLERISHYPETYNVIITFLQKHSAHIEVILYKEIHVTYLIIEPICMFLDDTIKDMVIENVRTDDAKLKIEDFIGLTSKIFDLIAYRACSKKNFVYINPTIFTFFNIGCVLITIIFNIC